MTTVVEALNEPFIFARSLDEGGNAPLRQAISQHTRVKIERDDYSLDQMLEDEASLTKRSSRRLAQRYTGHSGAFSIVSQLASTTYAICPRFIDRSA